MPRKSHGRLLSVSSEWADDDDNSHPVELDSNIYLSLLAIIYEK